VAIGHVLQGHSIVRGAISGTPVSTLMRSAVPKREIIRLATPPWTEVDFLARRKGCGRQAFGGQYVTSFTIEILAYRVPGHLAEAANRRASGSIQSVAQLKGSPLHLVAESGDMPARIPRG
jgi:hypothetical protein